MAPEPAAPRVVLYHATAPTCWWSWGYEPVLNRVRLVYGDQVDVRIGLGCPWTDLQDYYRQYGLDFAGVKAWEKEAREAMGVPLRVFDREEDLPRSLWPATQAAAAAYRQAPARGDRFTRELLRRFCAEGQDVTREDVMEEAARAIGLDVARFWADYEDGVGLRHDVDHMLEGFPHVGFYNLALTDAAGNRTVVLDHAFDPAVVEEAIDYLSGGALAKAVPRDVEAYLADVGPASEVEVARVFGLTREKARARLEALAHGGLVARGTLAGEPAWRSVRDGPERGATVGAPVATQRRIAP